MLMVSTSSKLLSRSLSIENWIVYMPLAVCRLHAATICMIVRSSLSDSFKKIKIKILISDNVRYQSSNHGYRDHMNVAKC